MDYDVSFGVDMDVLDAAMTDIESQFESFTGTGTRSGTVASTGGTGSYRTCSGGRGEECVAGVLMCWVAIEVVFFFLGPGLF